MFLFDTQCGAQYLVGNCEAWIRIGIFTFLFYIAEMSYDVSEIWKARTKRTAISVILTLSYHGAKIIYRAITLMTVNNYVYDVCRPVYRYLSQEDLYKSQYFLLHSKFSQSRSRQVAKRWQFSPQRFKPKPTDRPDIVRIKAEQFPNPCTKPECPKALPGALSSSSNNNNNNANVSISISAGTNKTSIMIPSGRNYNYSHQNNYEGRFPPNMYHSYPQPKQKVYVSSNKYIPNSYPP